jgi:hypothetical protein
MDLLLAIGPLLLVGALICGVLGYRFGDVRPIGPIIVAAVFLQLAAYQSLSQFLSALDWHRFVG